MENINFSRPTVINRSEPSFPFSPSRFDHVECEKWRRKRREQQAKHLRYLLLFFFFFCTSNLPNVILKMFTTDKYASLIKWTRIRCRFYETYKPIRKYWIKPIIELEQSLNSKIVLDAHWVFFFLWKTHIERNYVNRPLEICWTYVNRMSGCLEILTDKVSSKRVTDGIRKMCLPPKGHY